MDDLSKMSDAALWKQLVEHSREAPFLELMERHRSVVWGVCSRLLRGSDADDAFQMAFLALLEHGGRIRSPDFGPWLCRVAYHAVLRVRASRSAAERFTEPDQIAESPVTTDVLAAIEEAERNQLIAEAIDSLPERYREVIVLHYARGLRRDEIARRLNLTTQTVKSRLARGRSALRSRLLRRGVVLGMAGLFFDAMANSAEASAPPVESTWQLVQQTLAGEPVNLAKAQFSDLPEMEHGMDFLRGLKTRWTAGAVIAAAALFLVFEAGKSNESRDGTAMAGDANRGAVPQIESQRLNVPAEIPELAPIRLATADSPADLSVADTETAEEATFVQSAGSFLTTAGDQAVAIERHRGP